MKKERKNVLFVHSGDAWIRGSELVLLQCMSALQRGWNVSLVCSQTILAEKAKEYGFNVFKINLNKFIPLYVDNNPFLYLKTIFDLSRIVKREQIDIIHMTSAMSAQYCVPVAKWFKIITIVHIQEANLLPTPLKWSLISLADYLISVSQSAVQQLSTHSKLQVIYNGIDVNKFTPSSEKILLPGLTSQAKETVIVGTVGSLIPRKRIDIVIRTAAILAKIKPDIVFVIVGAGESELSLKILARDLGVSNRVFFLGERHDVHKLLPEFDAFMFPTEAEACPLVALEAMTCGVPVVSSGISCLKEVMDNERTGIIIDDDTNPGQYAAGILKLYDNPAYRLDMGQAARQEVLARFSEEAFLKNIQNFYNENFK
ncbi:MAG: glycosyltransferase family 4 protein [Bacteroidales bacterium]|nr:glycosyltransferase family 4 protein [Bacteroidales bacterium]